MMKRRHRIVHEADLTSPKDIHSAPWSISDDTILILWLLVVITFWTLLRVSVDPADEVSRWYLANRMKAIELARETRAKIIDLLDQPKELARLNFPSVDAMLSEVTALVGQPSVEEILAIWRKMKSPDDNTTEEQARASIVAWHGNGK